MARQGSSRFPRTGARSRRQTTWLVGPQGETGVISSSVSAVLALGTQAIANGLTIVRTRGELFIQQQSSAAIGDGFEGAFGLGIVSENASGIGVTAIPTPLADIGWDGWLYHRLFSVKAPTSTVIDGPGSLLRVEVDSKAMRKFKSTDVLVGVLEVEELGVATMQLTFRSRVLVKIS